MLFYKIQEFVSGALVLQENPGEGRCGGDRIGLLYSPDLHASMRCFNDNGHPYRVERVLDAVPYLYCEPLLHLEPACIGLYDPGNLAQPCDITVRYIGHMSLADERHDVVLACGIQLYVLHQHHLLVFLFEDRPADDFRTVLPVSLREELERLRHPLGSLDKPLPVRILSQQPEYLPVMLCNLGSYLLIIPVFPDVCHVTILCNYVSPFPGFSQWYGY